MIVGKENKPQAGSIFPLPYVAGAFLTNDGSTLAWEAVGPGDIVLTQNHIYVGNASNIATDVAMSGDATIVASGAVTLANTAVTPGSYTYSNITVDSKGRVTAASNGGLSKTAPLTGTGTIGDPLAINGLTGLAQGDLIYGSAADTFSRLAKATIGTQYLGNTGVGNNPAWGQVSLTAGVTGILSLTNGGTGMSTGASAGSVVYSTTPAAMAYSAVGTTGQALISGGTGAPTWFAPTVGSVIFAGTSGILQQDNNNFFWDDSNNRLGLGIATPQNREHLHNSSAGGAVATQYTNGTTGSTSTDGSTVGLDVNSDLVVQNLETTGNTIISANGKTWTHDFNGNLRASGNHNNATAQGSATQQDFRSGTYSPTLANQTNIDGTATASTAQWKRIGNVVTVSGMFTADPTLPTTATSFTLTLPVASNLGATSDLCGTAFCGNIAAMGAAIQGNVAGDIAVVRWISSDTTSQAWSYIYMYTVI